MQNISFEHRANPLSQPWPTKNAIDPFGARTLNGKNVLVLGGIMAFFSLSYCLLCLFEKRVKSSAAPQPPVQTPPRPLVVWHTAPWTCAEEPPKSKLSLVTAIPNDALFTIYECLDGKSFYSFSVTGSNFSLLNSEQQQVFLRDCIPSWIQRCTAAEWRSRSQKHEVSCLLRVLFRFPKATIFPASDQAPTIPQIRAIFTQLERGIRDRRFSDPLTDALHKTYRRLRPAQLEMFLRNIPTVWLIGTCSVTALQEISRRYEGELLTDQDKDFLGWVYQKGVGNFGQEFIQGASIKFLEAILTTFCIMREDRTNCFFVNRDLKDALTNLAQNDMPQFRQKFPLFLHFYDHQMVPGTSGRDFAHGQQCTLEYLLWTLAEVTRQQRLSALSILLYFFRVNSAPYKLDVTTETWIGRLRNPPHLAFREYEELSVDECNQLSKMTALIRDLETAIGQASGDNIEGLMAQARDIQTLLEGSLAIDGAQKLPTYLGV